MFSTGENPSLLSASLIEDTACIGQRSIKNKLNRPKNLFLVQKQRDISAFEDERRTTYRSTEGKKMGETSNDIFAAIDGSTCRCEFAYNCIACMEMEFRPFGRNFKKHCNTAYIMHT